MATLYPVAGCKIYIGAAIELPDGDAVEADFASVSWTRIRKWQQMGDFGDTAALITSQIIDEQRDIKQKGSRNAGQMQNVFAAAAEDEGQLALIAAEKTHHNYPFKIELNDIPAPRAFAATISQASPGVVTKVDHGLAVNDAVVFSTTGALPTGLTAGVTYYVRTVLDDDTFTVSATKGGSAINTSSAGSGTHTVTTSPTASQRMFMGLVMTAQETGGAANTTRNLNATVEINSNIVRVEPTGA
jgi:hypothetical protein